MLKELKAMYYVSKAQGGGSKSFHNNKNSTAITFLVLERTFTKIACSIINERGASV